jgi:hypothetical protein
MNKAHKEDREGRENFSLSSLNSSILWYLLMPKYLDIIHKEDREDGELFSLSSLNSVSKNKYHIERGVVTCPI